ncbi:MAG: Zn-dependent hydrolase [Candidatus Kapabacteria bacterium]|nr:Zn-dependent hydrolase [Candidatus Kapabacteria bacterium]
MVTQESKEDAAVSPPLISGGSNNMSTTSRRTFVQTALMASGVIIAGTFPVDALGGVSGEVVYRRPRLDLANECSVWACWIGHSTVLLKLGTTWVITDPVFSDVVGLNILGIRIGPRRHMPPALSVDEIPRPDVVLISHAHMDHLDLPSLELITQRWPNQIDVITPTNTSDILRDLPWRSVGELDWHGRTSLSGIDVQALEVVHNGWRFPGEPCRSAGNRRRGRSYNGYVIEWNGARVVFGGDTAYSRTFSEVTGQVDLAIMPIGSYEGFRHLHCTPEEALEMSAMMKARSLMPIHHLTFKQSPEPMSEPLQRLRRKVVDYDLVLAARLPGSTYSQLG